VIKNFKESLMNNKKLESLDFASVYEPNDPIFLSSKTMWGELSSECLNIFLNVGEWKNKTLKELKLNCVQLSNGKTIVELTIQSIFLLSRNLLI
jgi:hypothetical protein